MRLDFVVSQSIFGRVLPDIKSLTREELEHQFKAWGEPAYRVAQLLDWLHVSRAKSWVETCQLTEKCQPHPMLSEIFKPVLATFSRAGTQPKSL